MAKGTWSLATDPNDPIFSGKHVISSHNYRKNRSTMVDPMIVDDKNEDAKGVSSGNDKQNNKASSN